MANSINGYDHGILNWDTPTRVPPNAEPSSPDVSLASASLITTCSWQTLSTLSSDHLPILITDEDDLQTRSTSNLCQPKEGQLEQIQTRDGDHLSSVAVNNRNRNVVQPEEAPDRTVCVAVYVSAAFDTVCHNKLLSTINRSHHSPATSR